VLAAELDAGGGSALAIGTDLRNPDSIRAMAAAALERFGQIDVLVANAGVGHAVPVIETTEGQLLEQMEVNLLGVIRSAQAVLPTMRAAGKGHVLAIASVAAGCAAPGSAIYSATKAGVVRFCEGLRREEAPHGIVVTTVLPGFIATPMTAGLSFPMPPASRVGDAIARLIRRPRRELVIPRWYVLVLALNRVAPGLIDAYTRRSGGR
jgi:NAD(P)-dependent dehydrogenase (short-subunit alcohol dehydrogenase family)